jgi:formate hydrogenlyase subunit 4
MLTYLFLSLAQGLFLMLVSPLVVGYERFLIGRLQGRPRPVRFLLQPYVDLAKLMRIRPGRPRRASWFYRFAPGMIWGVAVFLIFTVPVLWQPLENGDGSNGEYVQPVLLFVIDMVLMVYLLGLKRFIVSLAGMDSGTAFGGLGGAREMFLNFVTEVNLFLLLTALALRWNSQSYPLLLSTLFQQHALMNWKLFTQPELVVLILSLGILILYEIERVPVGQPATHLELTMHRKAAELGWQGRDLAWIHLAEMLKMTFLLALFIGLFMPGLWPFPSQGRPSLIWQPWIFMGKLGFVMTILAVLTSTRAKLRLTKLPSLAFFAGALSLLSIVYMIATHMYTP